MSDRPSRAGAAGRLAVIFMLYLAQGIATSFLVLGVPAVLRRSGVALELLWVAYLPVILYAAKFLWAPLADRHWVPALGRRRTWLIPSTLSLAGSFLLLSQLPLDGPIAGLAVAFGLLTLSAATMDIATDGYAVELLEPAERGIGNGLQSAGLTSGSLIGRGVVLMLIDRFGWTAAMVAVAVAIPLVAAPGLLRREPPIPAAVARKGVAGIGLTAFLTRPDAAATLTLAVLTGLCHFLLGPIVGPFLIDAGLSLSQVGSLQLIVGTAAGIAGALAAGMSVNRVGPIVAYRIALGAGLVAALVAATVAATHPGSIVLLGVVVAVVNLATGGIFAVFYANVMGWCSERQAATDFTVISSGFALMAAIAGSGAGLLASRLGYSGHFLVVAGVGAVALTAIGVLTRQGGWPSSSTVR